MTIVNAQTNEWGKVEKQLPSTDFGLAMANDKITEIVNDKNSLKMN